MIIRLLTLFTSTVSHFLLQLTAHSRYGGRENRCKLTVSQTISRKLVKAVAHELLALLRTYSIFLSSVLISSHGKMWPRRLNSFQKRLHLLGFSLAPASSFRFTVNSRSFNWCSTVLPWIKMSSVNATLLDGIKSCGIQFIGFRGFGDAFTSSEGKEWNYECCQLTVCQFCSDLPA